MTQDSYEALGEITERGVLEMFSRDAMLDAIRRFPKGSTVVVSVKVERQTRSARQNRYWHGVVVPLFAEHCGCDTDDMKDILALELLPKEIADIATGEIRKVPGRTSALNTKEFNDLIERAQRLGASMGIVVPDPVAAGVAMAEHRTAPRHDPAPEPAATPESFTHYTTAEAHVDRRGNVRAICGRNVNQRSGEVSMTPTCPKCAAWVNRRDEEPLPAWAREETR
jgi:hypothetical protein